MVAKTSLRNLEDFAFSESRKGLAMIIFNNYVKFIAYRIKFNEGKSRIYSRKRARTLKVS